MNNIIFELLPWQKGAYTITAAKENGTLRYDLCVHDSPKDFQKGEWDDYYDIYRQHSLRRIFSTNAPFAIPKKPSRRLALKITENIGFSDRDLDDLCQNTNLLTASDITHLDLGFYLKDRMKAAAFMDRFPNLNSVDMSLLDKGHIKSLIVAKANLTSIHLSADITDNSVNQLASRFRALTSIDLSHCEKITDGAIKAIGQFCPKLSKINLYQCNISDAGVKAIALPSLSSISLYANPRLSDDSIITLAKQCKELVSVNIGYCDEITERSLIALAENCQKLEKLCIENLSEALTKNALQAFAEKGSKVIRALDLDYTPNGEIFKWAEQCKKVNQIAFWTDKDVSNPFILSLVRNFPDLTTLHLRWCNQIDSLTVGTIAQLHPRLSSINLDNDLTNYPDNYDMGDMAIKKIALHCHELTQISLKDCFKITDEGFAALAKGCHNLTMATLASCSFTDAALHAFGSYCHHLRAIDLLGNEAITDSGIEALAIGCPNLVFVGIQGCSKITQDALITLGKRCKEITFVDASDNEFSEEQIDELRHNNPEVGFDIAL